ncbi:RTA1 like protein-domain-containing protein [Ilyonectria sp. MPI-CAGE-AT-0026]|nr:RTA1 like protein-domain-containing protein [Ilyonectria sp. MPI-CAGE-AT-0026]
MSIQYDTWDATNATWVEDGGPGLYCFHHPKESRCDDVDSYYQYRVDMAPNAAFLAVFGASMVGYIITWIITRRGTAFNIALLLGLTCEILGYAGRVMSANNPWDENGFLIQICCLTIGPAFMAAGIYLCLRRIVSAFGPENSRLPPEYYTRIFIPCDVISLVLQALGGGMASVSSHNNESANTGSNIMIAGLAFQVITIFGFIVVSADFAFRTVRRYRAMGDNALDQRPEVARVRNSRLFKAFLGALSLATICILWRSAFRVAELSDGWEGPIMGDQGMFIGFEGVLIVVAVWVLNIFHPAFCMKELLELEDGGLKGLWCFRGRKENKSKSEGETASDSQS